MNKSKDYIKGFQDGEAKQALLELRARDNFLQELKLKNMPLNKAVLALKKVCDALRIALKEQVTGARWRKENEVENWNGCDDEALARAEAALKVKV